MQGRALGPVVLQPQPRRRRRRRPCCAAPTYSRRTLNVGVLVADPADRPGRGSRLLGGLRLGLDQARDLDVTVTAIGATAYGPALLDAATALLEGGADALVVTTTGVAGLVGPCARLAGSGSWWPTRATGSRTLPCTGAAFSAGPSSTGRRPTCSASGPATTSTARSSSCTPGTRSRATVSSRCEPASWRPAVTSSAPSRCGPRAPRRLPWWPAPPEPGWSRCTPRVTSWTRSSGPCAPRGCRPRSSSPDAASTSAPWPSWPAGVRCTPPPPGTAPTSPTWSSPSSGAPASGPTPSTALGYDVAGVLVEACRSDALPDLTTGPAERGLVVRRATAGRTSVVARRDVPPEVPDLDAASALPAIAALPHHG